MTEPQDDALREEKTDGETLDPPIEAPTATTIASALVSAPQAAAEASPHLLDPSRIRARRRPRAIFFVWLWELACALFVATPIHAWAMRVWGAHPDGDAVLFRPGGHALLSWLGDDDPALAIVVRTTLLALLVFGVVGQLVTGALVASLATGTGEDGRAPPTSFALRAAGASFFPLLGTALVFGALEGSVLGVGLFASSAVDQALQARIGDARAFTARLVVLALFVLAMLIVGVVGDLVRVVVARDSALDDGRSASARVRGAIVTAMSTVRRALGRASFAWGWRAALSLALVYVGARAGDFVGGRGGGALWLLFFVHQVIVLVRAALRASWLANALRLVSR